SIDWRDGGDSVVSYDREGVYWRKISVKENTEWKIEIKIFSKDKLVDDTIVTFPIKVMSPPLLDDKIYLNPRYCAPHDTAITIGVNVLSLEKGSYVEEILWIINENEPAPFFTFFREKFSEEEGKIPPKGRLFTHNFLINNLKGTNIVKIIVTDSNGNSSMISGVFYVAGKPE
ncbi:MAG: hypothetical protein N2053_07750, partial [Chitinispirillaceae bacterium]|nr:hypothetical protein [Chitinispirillaceae bacterium]